MATYRTKIIVVMVTLLLACFTASVHAAVKPGVTVGQYIQYGNFAFTGDFPTTGIATNAFSKDTNWIRAEVIAVTGNDVTMQISGKYKDGTDISVINVLVNVETGEMNGSSGGPFILLPANLTAGDSLPGMGGYVKINSTETRTYLGVSRRVNVVDYSISNTAVTARIFFVFDRASGILLEMNMVYSSSMVQTSAYGVSFNAIGTNVFATGFDPLGQGDFFYSMAAIIMILVVVMVAYALIANKMSPKAPDPSMLAPAPPPPAPDASKTETSNQLS